MTPSVIAAAGYRWPLIVAVMLLPVWIPVPAIASLKPSDALFLLAVLALLIFPNSRLWSLRIPRLALPVALFAISVLAATVLGAYVHVLPMSPEGWTLIARLAINIVLFAAVYRWFQGNPRSLILALCSPVLLFPLALIPMTRDAVFAVPEMRFRGLTPNPNTAALGLEVALCLAASLAAHRWLKRQVTSALAWGAVATAAFILVLLTQSRAYLIAGIVGPTLGAMLVMRSVKRGPQVAAVIPVVLMIVFLSTVLLFAFPTYFTNPIIERWNLADRGDRSIVTQLISLNFLDERFQIRVVALRYYADLVRQNPFGFGVNFTSRFTVVAPGSEEEHGPNTAIDLLVYGGVGAVVSVLWALRVLVRRCRIAVRSNDLYAPYVLASAAALAGIWTAGIFVGSPVFSYQGWILLGIAAIHRGDPSESVSGSAQRRLRARAVPA